jgi:inorganic pyrophosphatase
MGETMNAAAASPSLLGSLPAFAPNTGPVQVVIDTPQGSRCKYKYDEATGIFRLRKLLPLGARFPYSFGFVPSTRGEDGDPLDVLVILEEPLLVGSVVPVRLLGVLEAEQTEQDGKTVRNDRLLGVPTPAFAAPQLNSLEDLGPQALQQIEHFFVSYIQSEGRRFQPLGRRGPDHALQLIETSLETPRPQGRGTLPHHGSPAC